MSATEVQTALPLRSHTIFGVCEGLAEDFGFNPLLLRVPLAVSILFSPMIAIGTYAALGVLVLVSRLVFPNPKATAATPHLIESVPAAKRADEELQLAA